MPSYPDGSFWTSPYLLGDFGRAKLAARGIDLSLTMVDEAVANASGGLKHNSAQAGQFAFQAKFDMAKLAGIHGGLIGVTYVDRFGQNENTTAQIPALLLTNEVFGRGNILRLTELYYDQKGLFNGFLELKGGRLPVGADFFFGNCDFVNLTFCGGQPGNIQGGYIFNWPVSQWGGVAKFNVAKDVQLSVGAYDANPNYLTTADAAVYALPGIPNASAASGVMVPVELTWRPSWGRLAGVWRLGGWYDSSRTIDGGLPGIVTTVQGMDTSVAAQNLGNQRGRSGVYESIFQRVTADGPGKQGWYTFLNSSFADHRTAFEDYQISWGVQHKGTFGFRPDDEVGFAVGTTHVNSAAIVSLAGPANPNAGGNEVPLEAWYGWQATGWLNLKFDTQYVTNPGGRGFIQNGTTKAGAPIFVKTNDAWVFGLRTTVNF
ncbi:MAG: carbohydrate porin [Bradyrhizobiaceae bacterium]|nr:carbohydrate porin [Bradyrhizobiaceae bacterium]